MARKTYTREFKLQALKMITDQGLSVAEVARRLGVTEAPYGPGGSRLRSTGRPPSPVPATCPRRRTNSAACEPRTRGSGPSGTC